MAKPNFKEKRPTIDQKNSKFEFSDPGFSDDLFGLDADLKAELDSKGLVGRFVNIKEVEKFGGRHPKGWRVYKRDNINKSSTEWMFGSDPDGYVRRAELVLAVKTKEDADKHRRHLDQLAQAAKVTNLIKRHREEQRRAFKEAGMDNYAQLHEDSED
jgi:hypothetical protein